MCWLRPSGMIPLRNLDNEKIDLMTKKTVKITDKFSVEKSKKSKYISNSKLTKSSLFQSINGQHIRDEERVLREINMEIASFHKSLCNSVTSSPENQKLRFQQPFHEKLMEVKEFDLTKP